MLIDYLKVPVQISYEKKQRVLILNMTMRLIITMHQETSTCDSAIIVIFNSIIYNKKITYILYFN